MRFSSPRGIARGLCYCLIAVIVVEVVIVNTILLATLLSIKSEVSTVLNAEGNTLMDKLMKDRRFQEIVHTGKNGVFSSLIQETVGRMYIASYPEKDLKGSPHLSFLGIDVSSAGEALYLYRRIQSRPEFHYSKLIVDVGANDGLLSSNSYNFIQLGWSAILVEPQATEIYLAKANNRRNFNPYNEGHQNLTFVEGVLSDKNGFVSFVISPSSEKMESHILKDYDKELMQNPDPLIVKVQSYTVATFARKYKVPKNFGILSLDAEGEGGEILHQWMDLGYRPAYIVYEQLKNKNPMPETMRYLEEKGYRYLKNLGWNYIFEHFPLLGDD